MSWLSDHLFGSPKSKDETRNEVTSPTTDATAEIQNDTVTTSNTTPTVPGDTAIGGETGAVSTYENREVAAEWHVPLKGKLHKVEFEHGTTSGRRILWIDEKEVFRRDWMFKLVGDDTFELDDLRCVLRVDPAPSFKYKYSLFVDGKPLDQFKQRQAKSMRIWEILIGDKNYRVVLGNFLSLKYIVQTDGPLNTTQLSYNIEKDTLNIFLNGKLREEEGEFTDEGTETKWEEDGNSFLLSAFNSGNKHDGLLYKLTVNGAEIPESSITEET